MTVETCGEWADRPILPAIMIGVFDSGHGGLTILKALTQRLPDRHFVYLGDHGNAPYGNRSSDEVFELTVKSVDRLFGQGCRLVILACNTAAMSLRRIQQTWLAQTHPERRVLGVVVPMIEELTGLPWLADPATTPSPKPTSTVAVFATRRTVEAGVYVQEIAKRAPQLTVEQIACPHLAGMIEDGAPQDEMRPAVQRYVGELLERLNGGPLDAALLACTHYPLVAGLFHEALPAGVPLLAQPEPTASSLVAYLQRHPELDQPNGGGVTFLTTGEAKRIGAMASAFYGGEIQFRETPPILLTDKSPD
jgi:glutamate racemase